MTMSVMSMRLAPLLLMLPALALAQPAEVHNEPMDPAAATPILGREVLDPAGRPAGRIVDVLVDGLGGTRAAVVDFGGFLGIGQRRVAVAWRTLHFRPEDGGIILQLSADQIAAAPNYKPRALVLMAVPPPTPTLPPPQ